MRMAHSVLLLIPTGFLISRARSMGTRRMVYWWFRFVLSGRFLATFLHLRRANTPPPSEDRASSCQSLSKIPLAD
jgi:hypothetical protein